MIKYCQKSFFCIKYILIKFQIKSSLERNNQIIYGGNRALHKFKFLEFFRDFYRGVVFGQWFLLLVRSVEEYSGISRGWMDSLLMDDPPKNLHQIPRYLESL
jgi:hypothetical protein